MLRPGTNPADEAARVHGVVGESSEPEATPDDHHLDVPAAERNLPLELGGQLSGGLGCATANQNRRGALTRCTAARLRY